MPATRASGNVPRWIQPRSRAFMAATAAPTAEPTAASTGSTGLSTPLTYGTVGSRVEERMCMHQYCGRRIVFALAIVGSLFTPLVAAASQTPPDNTKVNERDRPSRAGHCRSAEGEHGAIARSRAGSGVALMDDKGLSMYAHNVKVIAQGGQVTLEGRRADEEAGSGRGQGH